MDDLDLVEVYVAPESITAHGLRVALEQAGISAIVTGDDLGVARGALPFGVTTSPRIWVPRKDQAAALEMIREAEDRMLSGAAAAETDDSDTIDEEPEEEEVAPADKSPSHFSFLSGLLGLAGVCLLLAGTGFSLRTMILARTYSGTTVGTLTTSWEKIANAVEHEQWQTGSDEVLYMNAYSYSVDGKVYFADYEGGPILDEVLIRYNPASPSDYHLGEFLSPAFVFGITFLLALFSFYLAYQFR